MRRLGLLALALLAFIPGLASAETFGAIEYSPSTGVYGYTSGYCSADEAAAAARGYCGHADCNEVVWEGGACAAMATGSNGIYGWAWNGDRGFAENNALDACIRAGGVSCSIAAWVCE